VAGIVVNKVRRLLSKKKCKARRSQRGLPIVRRRSNVGCSKDRCERTIEVSRASQSVAGTTGRESVAGTTQPRRVSIGLTRKKKTVNWINEDGLSLEARRGTVAGTTTRSIDWINEIRYKQRTVDRIDTERKRRTPVEAWSSQ